MDIRIHGSDMGLFRTDTVSGVHSVCMSGKLPHIQEGNPWGHRKCWPPVLSYIGGWHISGNGYEAPPLKILASRLTQRVYGKHCGRKENRPLDLILFWIHMWGVFVYNIAWLNIYACHSCGKSHCLLKGISVNQNQLPSSSVFTKPSHCHFTTLLMLHGHAGSSRTEKEHDPLFLNGMLQESDKASKRNTSIKILQCHLRSFSLSNMTRLGWT